MSDRPHNLERFLETDPRFPSGPWRGFYVQRGLRFAMDIGLEFSEGLVQGGGVDIVGPFVLLGAYDAASGSVRWVKRYESHAVEYEGAAEPDHGIWGMWTIRGHDRDGFQIKPAGSGLGSQQELEADVPEATFDAEFTAR